jgi:hypothetical protein
MVLIAFFAGGLQVEPIKSIEELKVLLIILDWFGVS